MQGKGEGGGGGEGEERVEMYRTNLCTRRPRKKILMKEEEDLEDLREPVHL